MSYKEKLATVAMVFVFAIYILVLIMSVNMRSIECGVCGAHVHDWWKIRNMSDTEFVCVCEYCYLDALED